jgi:hypothetical protein
MYLSSTTVTSPLPQMRGDMIEERSREMAGVSHGRPVDQMLAPQTLQSTIEWAVSGCRTTDCLEYVNN